MTTFLSILFLVVAPVISQKCSYGVRGSLTSTCENAVQTTFKKTTYKFDHLDETVICLRCNLPVIESNTFDISGNEILTLNLTQSNISVLKPNSFVGLVFMKNLLLQKNLITTISPTTFKGIQELLFLNMEKNKIETLQNDCFKELIKLQTLNLNDNQIEHIETNSFNGLDSLTELDISNNKITNIKDVFNKLKAIKTINLSNNKITSLEIRDINTTTLLELDLSANFLKKIKPDVFFFLRNLIVLNLSNNLVEEIFPGSFRGLSKLETLHLNNCSIQNIDRRVFMGLYSLRNINLAYNQIESVKTNDFTGIPHLSNLNLSFNRIKQLEIGGIFDLPRLHTLDLSNNYLTDLDYLALIKHTPVISILDLRGNKFVCHWIMEIDEFFKEENVDIKINRDFSSSNCTKNNLEKEYVQMAILDEKPDITVTNSYVVYSIFVLILMAIGFLFFMQYKVSKYLNDVSLIRRRNSEEDLIHNDQLEVPQN